MGTKRMNKSTDQRFTDARLTKNQDVSAAVCERNKRATDAADLRVSADELGSHGVWVGAESHELISCSQ